MSAIFRVKPLSRLNCRFRAQRPAAEAHARTGAAHLARHRRDHRRRHLLDGRHGGRRRGGSSRRRAGDHPLVRADGDRLRLRRAVLRRVRGDGAGLRLGLHLRVRDARRAGGVDHRLGPDHRVRDRQRRGRDLVVRLLPGAAARLRHASSGLARHRLPDRLPRGGRRRRGGGGAAGSPASAKASCAPRRRCSGAARLRHPDHLQPAGVPDRRADHGGARPRRPRERLVQHRDGRAEAGDHRVLPRRRRLLREARELDAVRAERLRRRLDGGGDHLLRLHRLRRGLDGGRGDARTRSATCRSASSPA